MLNYRRRNQHKINKMVVLGLRFVLLKSAKRVSTVPKGAAGGLYAGKGIMWGEKVTFSNKKTKRAWRPNIQRKTYRSDILGEAMNIRVTTHAMRCIDRAGGFDAYILHTPDKKLGSALGSELKERMQKTLSDNPQLTPPPKARRIQRQPKRWTLGRPPHKQNIFRLNLEHLLPARMRVGEVANGGGADGTPV